MNHPESIEYRIGLILTDRQNVLAVREKKGYCLPRVSISPGSRPARALHSALWNGFGIHALVLDFLGDDSALVPLAAVEADSLPDESSLVPVSLASVHEGDLPHNERQRLLEVMERRTRNPFARPGWIGDGIRWLESVTGIRVAEQNPYEQYNAGHGFTLIRFQMEDGSAYWLKATSGQNARELPVTLALSQLCGRYLPQVIDYRPDWNAWLSREEAVCLETWPEDCNEAQQILCRAVDALAAIQVSTIGSANTLFRAGASDQRPMTLAAGAESFFCYLEEAMGHQTSRKVPRISSARLGELRRLVEDSCARLDALNFPVTVVHGDMNLGNLLIGPEHCQITDWAEAYVGFPLCTLEHLLLLHPYSDPVRQRNEHHALKERYRCLLLAGYDAVQIDEAFVLAPLIAAFSALYGRGTWLTSPARDDPKRQSYARMLARHMDRAARKPAFLGTRCRHSTHAGMASVSA